MSLPNVTAALSRLRIPFDLAPLQAADVELLSAYRRVGLFWEVGAGKTVAATVLTASWESRKVVIAMPHVLIPQWADWLRIVDPGASIGIYYGPKRSMEAFACKYVLTSHSIFRNDFTKISGTADEHTTFIVDEAQFLKNASSVLFAKTKAYSATSNLIVMTATPTSSPEDAYSYITLKTPARYRNKAHFLAMHAGEVDFFNKITSWRNLDYVTEGLMLQASKRSKEEMFAGQLYPPVVTSVPYDLAPKHQKLYEQLVEECILELGSSGEKIDGTTPQRLHHLTQQMVVNFGFFADDPEAVSAALDVLDEVISQTGCLRHDRSKLLVWVWYTRSAFHVRDHIQRKYGDVVTVANGKTDSVKAVARFLHDPTCRMMVGHPDSVGVGFNAMTVCSEALYLEFPPVSMKTRQSMGRVDRVGQTRIPNIRFAVANRTIQVRLFNNLLKNDDTVSSLERNPQSLRDMLLGR